MSLIALNALQGHLRYVIHAIAMRAGAIGEQEMENVLPVRPAGGLKENTSLEKSAALISKIINPPFSYILVFKNY